MLLPGFCQRSEAAALRSAVEGGVCGFVVSYAGIDEAAAKSAAAVLVCAVEAVGRG